MSKKSGIGLELGD